MLHALTSKTKGGPMDSIKQSFVAQSHEQINKFKDGLLRMEKGEESTEINDVIFYCAHKIYSYSISAKYESDNLKCEYILEFMHELENVLDGVRSGTIVTSQQLVELLMMCSDHLGTLIDCVGFDREPDNNENLIGQLLLDRLQCYLCNAFG